MSEQQEEQKSPTPSERSQKNDRTTEASAHSQKDGDISRRSSLASRTGSRASQKSSKSKQRDGSQRDGSQSPPLTARSGNQSDHSEKISKHSRRSGSIGDGQDRKMSHDSMKSGGSSPRSEQSERSGKNSRQSSVKSNKGDKSPRNSQRSRSSSRQSSRRLSAQSVDVAAEMIDEAMISGKGNLERTASLPDISDKIQKIRKNIQNSPKPPMFYPHQSLIKMAARTTLCNGFVGNGVLQAFQPQTLQAMKEEQIDKLKKSLKHTADNQKVRLEEERTFERSRLIRSQPRSLNENDLVLCNAVQRIGEPQLHKGTARKWRPKSQDGPKPQTSPSTNEEQGKLRAQRKALKNTLFHHESSDITGHRSTDLDGRIPSCLRFPVNYGQQPRTRSCQHSPWGSVSVLHKHCIVSTYLPHPKGETATATRPLSAPSKLHSLRYDDEDKDVLPVTLEAADLFEEDNEGDADETNKNGVYHHQYSSPRVSFAEGTDGETPRTARSDRPKSAKRRTSTIPDGEYEDDVDEYSGGSSLDDETDVNSEASDVSSRSDKEPAAIKEEADAEDEEDTDGTKVDYSSDNESVTDSVNSKSEASVVESDKESNISSGRKAVKKKPPKHRKKSSKSKRSSSIHSEASLGEEDKEQQSQLGDDAITKREEMQTRNENEKRDSNDNKEMKDNQNVSSASVRSAASPAAHFNHPNEEPYAAEGHTGDHNEANDGNSDKSSEDSLKYSENDMTGISDSDGEAGVENENLNAIYEKSSENLNDTYKNKSNAEVDGNQSESDNYSIEVDNHYNSDSVSEDENIGDEVPASRSPAKLSGRSSRASNVNGTGSRVSIARNSDSEQIDEENMRSVVDSRPSSRTSRVSKSSAQKIQNGTSRRRSSRTSYADNNGSTILETDGDHKIIEEQDEQRTSGSRRSSKTSKASAQAHHNGTGSQRSSRVSLPSREINESRRDSKSSRTSFAQKYADDGSVNGSRRSSNVSRKALNEMLSEDNVPGDNLSGRSVGSKYDITNDEADKRSLQSKRGSIDNQSMMSQMSYDAEGHGDIPDVIRPSDTRRSSRASRMSVSRNSVSQDEGGNILSAKVRLSKASLQSRADKQGSILERKGEIKYVGQNNSRRASQTSKVSLSNRSTASAKYRDDEINGEYSHSSKVSLHSNSNQTDSDSEDNDITEQRGSHASLRSKTSGRPVDSGKGTNQF